MATHRQHDAAMEERAAEPAKSTSFTPAHGELLRRELAADEDVVGVVEARVGPDRSLLRRRFLIGGALTAGAVAAAALAGAEGATVGLTGFGSAALATIISISAPAGPVRLLVLTSRRLLLVRARPEFMVEAAVDHREVGKLQLHRGESSLSLALALGGVRVSTSQPPDLHDKVAFDDFVAQCAKLLPRA
jgi:hypothetical protein